MDTSQDAPRSDEPIAHNGGVSRQQTGVSPNEQAHTPTRAEISPGLAWSEQNLLSLDGGGIRGYWTLLVLEKLMQMIASQEIKQSGPEEKHHHSFFPETIAANVTQGGLDTKEKNRLQARGGRVPTYEIIHTVRKYLPCHYFDYICGSSTGALIAIMLGRFRMSVWDCLQEYEDMSHSIFGKPRKITQLNTFIIPREKYSARALEKAFRNVTAKRCEETLAPNVTFKSSEASPRICKTFVTSLAYERRKGAEISLTKLYLLRTYTYEEKDGWGIQRNNRINTNTLRDNNKVYGSNWEIWKVARAATAAPMYFKELREKRHMIDDETTICFSDGGFNHTNNPTIEGIDEIKALHGEDSLGAVVSVGTSRSQLKPGGKSIINRATAAAHIATDPDAVAGRVASMKLPYDWRFNDDEGIDVYLDDWKPNGYFTKHPGIKTLSKIRQKFNQWAGEEENIRALKECAKELVLRRRARLEDPAMWKVYATNASFSCRVPECHLKPFDNHMALSNHLRVEHSIGESELPAKVEQATKMWRYQKPKR